MIHLYFQLLNRHAYLESLAANTFKGLKQPNTSRKVDESFYCIMYYLTLIAV